MTKHQIDYNLIDEAVKSKITKGSIIPRPIAWITTLNKNGTINLAPFSYFNAVSSTLLSVSFQRTKDKQKDTLINILREKEAVVHIVDESLIEAMDLTSTPLAVNESEVNLTNLTLSESMKVKTPGIEEAMIRFEVLLEERHELKNYKETMVDTDLVILRIVSSILDEKVYDKENNYILADNLQPVSRLGGPNYAGIKNLSFQRKY